jgi:hypothetical protein
MEIAGMMGWVCGYVAISGYSPDKRSEIRSRACNLPAFRSAQAGYGSLS